MPGYWSDTKIASVLAGLYPSSLRRQFRDTVLPEMGKLAVSPGAPAFVSLRLAANVADGETITIGSEVYEIDAVATDTTDNTAGGSFNNTTDPLTVDLTTYTNVRGLALGALIRIENEILKIIQKSATGYTFTFKRGVSGTTTAAHADAADIFKSAAGVTAGNKAIGFNATFTPAVASLAIAADITRESTAVKCIRISDNELHVVSLTNGALTTAVSETLAGANNAFDGSALANGMAPASKRVLSVRRVPTAQEVALGNLIVWLDFVPVSAVPRVVVTATGVAKAWDGGVTLVGGSNPYVKLDNVGATDWAATDTIDIFISE